MLPHSILTRGRNIDLPCTGVLFTPTISQQKNKEPQQSTACRTAVQYTQSTEHVDTGDSTQDIGMEERMCILSRAREEIQAQAPRETETNCP